MPVTLGGAVMCYASVAEFNTAYWNGIEL